jgi:hypothetical protein
MWDTLYNGLNEVTFEEGSNPPNVFDDESITTIMNFQVQQV